MIEIVMIKELGKNIVTRNSLQTIFKKIEKSREKEITINFKDVEFMSRSSADEYLLFKEKTAKSLKEINQSKDVKKMLELVERNKKIEYNLMPQIHKEYTIQAITA